jgi:hypothetical protein
LRCRKPAPQSPLAQSRGAFRPFLPPFLPKYAIYSVLNKYKLCKNEFAFFAKKAEKKAKNAPQKANSRFNTPWFLGVIKT